MAKKPKINAFMAYWDTLGFEWIENAEKIVAALVDNK